jgi:uncharacterized phage infection (PIP) family protein YhgE
MNLKLDELRKLLLQPEPPMIRVQERRGGHTSTNQLGRPGGYGSESDGDEAKNSSGERGAAVSNSLTSEVLQYVAEANLDENGEAKSQYQLALAVAKVFEPTKTFQESLARLTKTFEQVDILGQSASRALAPMRAFADQVAKIAQNFGPMKAFQDQLAQLASNFEPMKGLHEQLAQIGQSFHDHLTELSLTLEPAKKLQGKVAELARSLESVSEMQDQFDRLAESFKVGAAPANGAGANGSTGDGSSGYANGASQS